MTTPPYSGSLTVDGSTSEMEIGAKYVPLGFNTLYAKGGFGGGTLQVEVSPDGTQWFAAIDAVSADDISLTVEGVVNFQVKAERVRLTLSGSTTPTINWWVL